MKITRHEFLSRWLRGLMAGLAAICTGLLCMSGMRRPLIGRGKDTAPPFALPDDHRPRLRTKNPDDLGMVCDIHGEIDSDLLSMKVGNEYRMMCKACIADRLEDLGVATRRLPVIFETNNRFVGYPARPASPASPASPAKPD